MIVLAIFFGVVVGFALGLTGGGGGVFAVPLLVYGLSVPPREAVGISLAAVGGTALFGVLPRLRDGQVEWRTGLLFAIAGMIGAPIGSWLSQLITEQALLLLFAVLMCVVGYRMWTKSAAPASSESQFSTEQSDDPDHSACQRDRAGDLRLTSRCARLLVFLGLLTGVLSGLFGVGGGFVIVPALVLFSGMAIHRAVGTSLFVIVLISFSGVTSHLLSGNQLSLWTAGQFLVGGLVGIGIGSLVSRKIGGPTLQKIFAAAVFLVAIFVLVQSTFFSSVS